MLSGQEGEEDDAVAGLVCVEWLGGEGSEDAEQFGLLEQVAGAIGGSEIDGDGGGVEPGRRSESLGSVRAAGFVGQYPVAGLDSDRLEIVNDADAGLGSGRPARGNGISNQLGDFDHVNLR
ncbi:MAG: hypothetical protein DRQ10_04695 [Candidatus Hydrothermota bacterium]|nr:MAG: hypothetical protein DRQ10_04695 [Candidatus Hydrothermae bacterium]